MADARGDERAVARQGGDNGKLGEKIFTVLRNSSTLISAAIVLFVLFARHLLDVVQLPGVKARVEHEERCADVLHHVRCNEAVVWVLWIVSKTLGVQGSWCQSTHDKW